MRIVTVENIYHLSNPNSTPRNMVLTVFGTMEVGCGILDNEHRNSNKLKEWEPNCTCATCDMCILKEV